MRHLTWSASHAVFITEIDDEHKEIFEALSRVEKAVAGTDSAADLSLLTIHLASTIVEHFAHEERLMRAARYSSIRWHREKHNTACKRLRRLTARVAEGDVEAGPELVEYLTAWLHQHTRLADQMLAAFLRNQHRGLWKVTFQAGTKPLDACAWFDASGNCLDTNRARLT